MTPISPVDRVQRAWDSVGTLPPIEWTESEAAVFLSGIFILTPQIARFLPMLISWGPHHPEYPNQPSDWNGGPVLCSDGEMYAPPVEWCAPSGGADVRGYISNRSITR